MNTTVIIAVDIMGSDKGIKTLLKGLERSRRKSKDQIRYLVFGNAPEITSSLQKFEKLRNVCEVRHCEDVVSMEDKPSQIMRRGKSTSMYAAIEAVKNGEAQVAVSCGNTGALMALSMLILRKLPSINRPAIAVLWPSRSPKTGLNIMLDAGADIKADSEDLVQFAVMGASYARNGFDIEKPRVGLLNIGTEAHKGHPELQEAKERIESLSQNMEIDFLGFVEGNDLTQDKVDVIVTDGFTGNVALKTGEGVARFINDSTKLAFMHNWLSRIGATFAFTALQRLRKKLDPRRSNGGVFLGLNGTVIKSHGSSDYIAMSSAIKLAYILAQNDFHSKVTNRLAKVLSQR